MASTQTSEKLKNNEAYFLCEVRGKNSSVEEDGGEKRVMYLKEV